LSQFSGDDPVTKTTRKKKQHGWVKGKPRELEEKNTVRTRWLDDLTDYDKPLTEYAKSNRINLKMSDTEMAALDALARRDGVSPGIVLRRLVMARSFEVLAKMAVSQ
jgi:hypothetical protein